MKKYPNSQVTDEVKKKIEGLDYEDAVKQNTLSDYESFLKKYPDSPFNAEIDKTSADIYFENKIWKEALKKYKSILSELKGDNFLVGIL